VALVAKCADKHMPRSQCHCVPVNSALDIRFDRGRLAALARVQSLSINMGLTKSQSFLKSAGCITEFLDQVDFSILQNRTLVARYGADKPRQDPLRLSLLLELCCPVLRLR